jgi:hypothetical protein
VGDRQPGSPGRRPVLPGLVRLSSDAVQNPHVIKGRRTLGFELGLVPILFRYFQATIVNLSCLLKATQFEFETSIREIRLKAAQIVFGNAPTPNERLSNAVTSVLNHARRNVAERTSSGQRRHRI